MSCAVLVASGCCDETPQTGGFNIRQLLLMTWEKEVQVQGAGPWVPSEDALPGLQVALVLLCPHGGIEASSPGCVLQGHWCGLQAPPPHTVTTRVGASTRTGWGAGPGLQHGPCLRTGRSLAPLPPTCRIVWSQGPLSLPSTVPVPSSFPCPRL